VQSYRDFIRAGGEARERFMPLLKERAEGAPADDTAILVYTSGTTGKPKGACLSHRYILNSVESLRATVPIYETDTAFSYLPYCHVAERISGLYNRLYAGASAHFVDDLSKLGQYMKDYFGGRLRLATSGGGRFPRRWPSCSPPPGCPSCKPMD
jgi:long-chain acyl-CoA synthetase